MIFVDRVDSEKMFDYADKDGDGLLDYYDLQFAFQRNNRDFEDWVRVLKVLRLKNPDMKYVVILTERDYLPKIEITTKFDEEEYEMIILNDTALASLQIGVSHAKNIQKHESWI